VNAELPRLHAITDERIARRTDMAAVAEQLAAAGGSAIALHARGRNLSGREHFELASQLSNPPTCLFVNDRLDVALAANASGVQLAAGSLPVSSARALNAQWWIGKSVHDLAQAETAQAEGADYLLIGPVYATATHPDRPPIGLDALRRIARLELPVIAIGGITAENAGAVRDTGAYGIAVIRALWDAADPATAAKGLLKEWP
jgi:thiamine-phosphate diphosphorylase